MTKWVCNETNFEQSVNNVTILPAVKQAIMLHYFPHEQDFELDGIYDDDDKGSDSDIVNNNESNQSDNHMHSKKIGKNEKWQRRLILLRV